MKKVIVVGIRLQLGVVFDDCAVKIEGDPSGWDESALGNDIAETVFVQ